jgi:energy-coupling factor transport system ATP-binding protein
VTGTVPVDPGAPALVLAGASVRYPARRAMALEGIDLTISAGETVGLTGRTGAGKSTLALLAAGFIPRVVRATMGGTTTIDGVAASATSAPGDLLGRVGIVFSTPANQLSASKPTVREELAFGLENLAVPRAAMDARIDDILDRLGIAHLADREPFSLSGGEQQRVGIASIVAMGPRLLVLDEPTAQLDPAGTAEVGALLASLAAGGTAILCAEHDPDVLAGLARVAVLDAGRIVGVDVPGVALGMAVAGRARLPAPTLVRLAELAGVAPAAAFDVRAVAAGLAAVPADRLAVLRSDQADDAEVVAPPTPGRAVPTIEVDSLIHRYASGVEAVRGISLRIEPGEAVAIVGANGSGKTTLAKHLDGLLRPTAGEVRLDGRPTIGVPIDRLAATIGFAFQDPADQLFERSVEREVAFGPRNLGFATERITALVAEALAAAGLSEARATNPYDLDASQRKLVALASVLAMDPAILVLDEPTTGQDPAGVARVRSIVAAWHGAGRTVIAITHDLAFAAAAFDRVVALRDGTVIDDGPPDRVLAVAGKDGLTASGLTPPSLARVAGALRLGRAPTDVAGLVAALRARG